MRTSRLTQAALLTIAAVAFGGCSVHGTSAFAYRRPLDRAYVLSGLANVFGEPCWRKERSSIGEIYAFSGEENCYDLSVPRIMEGVWVDDFEGQEFIQKSDAETGRTWIDFKSTPLPADRMISGGKWDIKFLGRETTHAGRYGHMGMSRRWVIVDRLIALSPHRKE